MPKTKTQQHRFDPSPSEATDAALEMAIRPFIERFVREDKRERALSLFLPKSPKASWHELIGMIDTARARPFEDETLDPWKGVPGVFVIDHDAYSTETHTAMGLYCLEDALFVAYTSTFAVVRYHDGSRLLLT